MKGIESLMKNNGSALSGNFPKSGTYNLGNDGAKKMEQSAGAEAKVRSSLLPKKGSNCNKGRPLLVNKSLILPELIFDLKKQRFSAIIYAILVK